MSKGTPYLQANSTRDQLPAWIDAVTTFDLKLRKPLDDFRQQTNASTDIK